MLDAKHAIDLIDQVDKFEVTVRLMAGILAGRESNGYNPTYDLHRVAREAIMSTDALLEEYKQHIRDEEFEANQHKKRQMETGKKNG